MSLFDHLGISVDDLPRSIAQFDPVMQALGCTRQDAAESVSWYRGEEELILFPARHAAGGPHRHGRVGWQHLAFAVDSRAEVDRLHAIALDAGWTAVREPKPYPRFNDRYYASFVEDDNGIRIEFMHNPPRDSAADLTARRAGPNDAETVARLLHDFNTEFDTPTPGAAILAERLRSLLAAPSTIAYLIGEPAAGVALVTLRSNVWYDGPVALLDELYVAPDRRGHGLGGAIIRELIADAEQMGVSAIEINVDADDVDAQRFYERHEFSGVDPDTGERAFYYSREL